MTAEITAQALVLFALAAVAPMCAWLVGAPRPLLVLVTFTGVLQLGQAFFAHGSVTAWAVGISRMIAVAALAGWQLRQSWKSRRWLALDERAFDVALLYGVVGSVWWLAWVGDFAISGFSGLQALLTAAHFHVAGLGACTLAGFLVRWFQGAPGQSLLNAAVVAMISGVAVMAVGIAVYRPLEQAAAWWVALAAAGLAAAMLIRAATTRTGVAKTLSGLSGLSPLIPAALAVHFSQGGFAALGQSSLQTMIFFHAVPNAIGFVGLGLLSFALERGERTLRGSRLQPMTWVIAFIVGAGCGAAPADFVVVPSRLDFGTVFLGYPSTADVLVFNTGGTALELDVKISGGFSAPRQVPVRKDATVAFEVSFSPKTTGEFDGTLSLSAGAVARAVPIHATVVPCTQQCP